MTISPKESLQDSNTLKIALIGCGRAIEKIYLPIINSLHNIKITAAVDPIMERRNLVSEKFNGCIAYNSMDENLVNQIDAGIVTAPPDTHISLASKLLKGNKFVLVEKPLSLSMDGIKELIKIEYSSKASLMMGFNHRYWLPINKLKEKISGNSKIDFAEIIFTSDYNKWNPVSFISDPLDDLGPHVFDLIRYLFNKEIISISANPSTENEFNLNIKMAKHAYIHCHLAHCEETIRTINITGKSGKFCVSIKSIRIFPDSGLIRNFLDINQRIKTKLMRQPFPINRSYELQLIKFFEFIRSAGNANPGIEDGIAAIKAVEAARKSINNKGKEIFLNEIK